MCLKEALPTLSPSVQGVAVCYDPQYALRLCLERGLHKPCVYVYAAMGLYEESVDLALKVGWSPVGVIQTGGYNF